MFLISILLLLAVCFQSQSVSQWRLKAQNLQQVAAFLTSGEGTLIKPGEQTKEAFNTGLTSFQPRFNVVL
jgi:hypothetical protein